MSFASYQSLKTAIGDWLDRSDLDTVADDFIDLAEARIYRELRVRQMETALNVTMSSGVAAIPSDYLELRFAYIDGSPTGWLDVMSLQDLHARYPTRSSDGRPQFIARDGGNFVFGPFPDDDYVLKGVYYGKTAALSTASPTNWLTDDAPDLILFASLVESAPWTGDDKRHALWEAKYQTAKYHVLRDYQHERFPRGASLMTRLA